RYRLVSSVVRGSPAPRGPAVSSPTRRAAAASNGPLPSVPVIRRARLGAAVAGGQERSAAHPGERGALGERVGGPRRSLSSHRTSRTASSSIAAPDDSSSGAAEERRGSAR
ncbi:hypothetical protein STRIP9103_07895, partial [Streptomyces ipomoeae 91-03]